ncbi:choline BCCT transporter BetT [Arenivirga flava]|uniref:High-affinity choline transporter BetT n=1 Tax=Arenivirga flava TaxID=1930060 RepID=A0AA37UIK4_9MICO|nr:choline BCCT transporter BetT [Arenivirga flava]GMA28406.1 high-affinity choline transporter BetT [Arenivirga flava]
MTTAPRTDGGGRRRRPLADVNPLTFFSTAGIIVAISIWAVIDTSGAEGVIGSVVEWVSVNLGWYYFLIVTAVLVFVVAIAVSRIGRVKLGPDHAKPEFNLFTWGAMLFAAGIGIDLMFFSVSEPVSQYLAPPQGDGSTVEAARQAIVWTLFHYGLTGWGLYALVGLALGYFAYRHNMPLSLRSALVPIFGQRVQGRLGDLIDTAAMLGTVFGIATSLGIGVVQLNFGFEYLFGWEQGLPAQIGLIIAAVVMATLSVVSGVKKGIRRLSELNVYLAVALMVFILVAGPTTLLLDGIMQNIGDYLARFPGMSLDTMAYDRPDAWMSAWTLFFWAWWVAWAPFVGLFLARISRGRTIRQFVTGVLVVPFAFIALWISIFGNGALAVVMGGDADFGETAANVPEEAFYSLLDQYPLAPLTAAIATFTGLLFYVTSADSGALVMAKFTSRPGPHDADGAKWLRVFWAVITGVLTLAMLSVGGVTTLQNATIVMGLPLSVLLVFIMLGVLRALRLEGTRLDSAARAMPSILSGHSTTGGRPWRQRLASMVRHPGRRQIERQVGSVVEPALRSVAEELREQGVHAEVTVTDVESCGIPSVDLRVSSAPERGFRYQVYPVRHPVPSYNLRAASTEDHYFALEVFLLEGSQGYPVTEFTEEQLIADVLDQYQRHLAFLHSSAAQAGSTVIAEPGTAPGDWETDFAPGKDD